MATKSRTRTRNKREKWEEREARLLCKSVYDHLAYYIQVQLPEERFVGNAQLKSAGSSRINKTSLPRGYNSEEKKPEEGKFRSTKPSTSFKSASSVTQDQNIKANTRSKRTRCSRSIKQSTKNTRRSKSSGSVNTLLPPLEASPYLTNPPQTLQARKNMSGFMRREAERVASTASQLLSNISLNEVMVVQKYRSPCKSWMACSSSLSDHPNGMLTSNTAIRYAAEHNDREAARKYAEKTRKKQKRTKKNNRPEKTNRLISSTPNSERYRASTMLVNVSESSSSSETSDDESCDSEESTPRANPTKRVVPERSSSSVFQTNEEPNFESHRTEQNESTADGRSESLTNHTQLEAMSPTKSASHDFAYSREDELHGSDGSATKIGGGSKQATFHSLTKQPSDNGAPAGRQPKLQNTSGTNGTFQAQPRDVNHEIAVASSQANSHSISDWPDPQKSTDTEVSDRSQLRHPIDCQQLLNQNVSSDDEKSSTTSSVRRLIEEARSSLSVLGSSSSSSEED